jgi:hypothetical protein
VAVEANRQKARRRTVENFWMKGRVRTITGLTLEPETAVAAKSLGP